MEQSYKEKYEAILARLERAKNDNDVCDERFCCVIDDLIPELAESEDEKVGKELIKHLKELSDWKEDEVIPVKNPSYYRQWASWLEKQEEHANFRNMSQMPDKIYIQPNAHDGWFEGNKPNDNFVEYVRKNVFIEKTCDWLKGNITNNPNANSVLVRNGCVTLSMLVDDFKKYMEE